MRIRRAATWSILTIGIAAAALAMGESQRGGGRGGAAPAAPPAAAQAAPAAPGGLPDGEGKDFVTANCGGCHGLDQVQGAKHSLPDWTETLKRMVTYGATVTDAQLPSIASYLAKNFSDGSAPKTDDKERLAQGQKILETACTTCHDLGPVQRRNDDKAAWEGIVYGMVGNGADVKDAEIPVLVDYLVNAYGPAKDAPAPAPAAPTAPAGRGGRGARGQ